jgi:hypothetical protein
VEIVDKDAIAHLQAGDLLEVYATESVRWYALVAGVATEGLWDGGTWQGYNCYWMDTSKDGKSFNLTRTLAFIPFGAVTRWGENILEYQPQQGTFVLITEDIHTSVEIEQRREKYIQDRLDLQLYLQVEDTDLDVIPFSPATFAKLMKAVFRSIKEDVVSSETDQLLSPINCPRSLETSQSCNHTRAGYRTHSTPVITILGPLQISSARFWHVRLPSDATICQEIIKC